jgi:hypothetical protein
MYLNMQGCVDYIQGETVDILNMRIKDAWLDGVIDQEWWGNGDFKLTKLVGEALHVFDEYRCDKVPLISIR